MIDTQALQSLFDDEALVRKYLKRFMADMPDLLRQIRSACEARNWNELSIHAHSYKSQMHYINEQHAGSLANELEEMSAISSPDVLTIEGLINQLEYHLQQTIEGIKQITG